MRCLIAIALGLLLLVSAAAAIGSDNTVITTVYENTSGMCITNGNLAQIIGSNTGILGNDNTATQDLEAISGEQLPEPYGPSGQAVIGANFIQRVNADIDLTGCDTTAMQVLNDTAGENVIVGNLDENGLPDGRTNFIQVVNASIRDSGNNNVDKQFLNYYAFLDLLTIGNMTGISNGNIDVSGNNNQVIQGPSIFIGQYIPSQFDSLPFTTLTRSDYIMPITVTACVMGDSNHVQQAVWQSEFMDHLTDSKFLQAAMTTAYVTGNTNNVLQAFNQIYDSNDLTNSKLYLQTDINANILGNGNNLGIGSGQFTVQNAIDNDMTNSFANELITLDEQITGNCNDVIQSAETNTTANCFTDGLELQNINAEANSMGCGNFIDQSADLENLDNCVTGGIITQQVDIQTNS